MYTLTRFAFYVYVDFLKAHLCCLAGCLSMVVWTHALFCVCYMHVLYIFVFAHVQHS